MFFSFDHRNQALNTQLKTYTKIPWVTTETQQFQNSKKVDFNVPLKGYSAKSKKWIHFCSDILFFNSIQNTERKWQNMDLRFSMWLKFTYYFMSEKVRKFRQKEVLQVVKKKKSLIETSKVNSNIQAKRRTHFTLLSRICRYSSLLPERYRCCKCL